MCLLVSKKGQFLRHGDTCFKFNCNYVNGLYTVNMVTKATKSQDEAFEKYDDWVGWE